MGELSILCHRPGQVPQPPSVSIPQACHDPCLSPKATESSPANCPAVLAEMLGTCSVLCTQRSLCVFVVHSTLGEKWVWITRSLHTKTPENKRLSEQ